MRRTQWGICGIVRGFAPDAPHYGELTINLLACRAEIAVHPLAAQVALFVRGGVDDRGCDPPLHGNGSRSPIR